MCNFVEVSPIFSRFPDQISSFSTLLAFHVERLKPNARCIFQGFCAYSLKSRMLLSARRRLLPSDQNISPQGVGHRDRLLPLPMR